MAEGFLREVYDLQTQADTDAYYSKWAETYDEELTRNGYQSPARCAEALARFVPLDAPILDIGCGTGLSGATLAEFGFTDISGQDPNAEMLEVARRRGVYRELRVNDIADPYPFEPGRYAVLTAIGVIGIGAAPASVLGESIDALAPGGHIVFTYNDHALESPEYAGAVTSAIDDGRVEEILREHGPNIETLGVGSTVFVLRRR